MLPRSFLPGLGGGPGINTKADNAELDELERRMTRPRKSFAPDWMSEEDRQVELWMGRDRHDEYWTHARGQVELVNYNKAAIPKLNTFAPGL